MATVKDILNLIDGFAPFSLQEDYDNSGLIAGSVSDNVVGVMLSVDVTMKVIDEAIDAGCNLIVAHHPILFESIKRLTDEAYSTAVVLKALRSGINIIAAHTNIDIAENGINDKLANLLGGKNIVRHQSDPYAREFEVTPCSLYAFAETVKAVLDDSSIRTIGKDEIIERAIVIGGSGGSEEMIKYAVKNDAVFLTADLKHHLAAAADDLGAKIIVFGHFTSERIFVTILKELLKQAFGSLKIAVSRTNDNPYRYRSGE